MIMVMSNWRNVMIIKSIAECLKIKHNIVQRTIIPAFLVYTLSYQYLLLSTITASHPNLSPPKQNY